MVVYWNRRNSGSVIQRRGTTLYWVSVCSVGLKKSAGCGIVEALSENRNFIAAYAVFAAGGPVSCTSVIGGAAGRSSDSANWKGGWRPIATLIDLLLLLDSKSTVQQILYCSETLPGAMKQATSEWIGLHPKQLPEIILDDAEEFWTWRGYRFQAQRIIMPEGDTCVLLRREPLRECLMEAALNLMGGGVELYGPDASIQFLNRATKQLLDIPEQDSMAGQYLPDLYLVDEEFSTTLTALRTQRSIENRYDSYKSTTGKDLLTVNSAYPVFRPDGSLLGSVTFEQDMPMVCHQISNLQKIQQTLTRQMADTALGVRSTRYTLDDLVVSSPQMQDAVTLAQQMAAKDINVLIQGETGTGKEIFAQGIHALSSRRNEKFVAVNCAAFPETLIEGMLFGSVKGAFTGSVDKMGLIETANHGTLFLDELNSMSLSMQAKLLRVLQEGTLQRVGSTQDIQLDIRVISSCNEDAFVLSESGALRKDLFYRLAPVVIEVPPLRERPEELESLIWHYIQKKAPPAAQPIQQVEPEFWDCLRRYRWPGNVRELFHILKYAVTVSQRGVLRREDLPTYFLRRIACSHFQSVPDAVSLSKPAFSRGLNSLVQEYERLLLLEAYSACGQNATKTAELLQISRQNFQYYAKKYRLNQK